MSKPGLLDAIRTAADLHAATGDNLRMLVGIGGSTGISNAELVQASGLSRSAVAKITVTSGTGGRGLDSAEIEVLLQHAKTVAIVAAGRNGYRDYRSFHAYICQPNRHFDRDTERFGFYAGQEVKPEFPKILDSEHGVIFNEETAAQFRSEGRDLLADVVEKVVAVGARDTVLRHDVYALSAPDDTEQTLRLDAPIKHITSGPGTGFVQKQRYVSEHALRQNPKTTRELLDFDR